jgi:hypothetical protein
MAIRVSPLATVGTVQRGVLGPLHWQPPAPASRPKSEQITHQRNQAFKQARINVTLVILQNYFVVQHKSYATKKRHFLNNFDKFSKYFIKPLDIVTIVCYSR